MRGCESLNRPRKTRFVRRRRQELAYYFLRFHNRFESIRRQYFCDNECKFLIRFGSSSFSEPKRTWTKKDFALAELFAGSRLRAHFIMGFQCQPRPKYSASYAFSPLPVLHRRSRWPIAGSWFQA